MVRLYSTIFFWSVTTLSVAVSAENWNRTSLHDKFFMNQGAMAQDLSGVLYAGSLSGVHRSTDNGQTWVLVNSEISLMAPFAMQINPLSNAIFSANEDGLYRSTDSGVSWVFQGGGLVGAYGLAARGDGLLLSVGSNGIHRSTDDGSNWVHVREDISGAMPVTPCVSRSGHLFAPMLDGLFRSKDHGNTWELVSGSFDNAANISAVAIDSRRNILYAADIVVDAQFFSHANIYRSLDEGDSWIKVYHEPFAVIQPLFVDSKSTVYSGGINFSPPAILARGTSIDQGVTWQPIGPELPGDVFFFMETRGGKLFAISADSGVYTYQLPPNSCCVGIAGNIDCDPGDNVDISDLSRLIDFLYISFAPLCCVGEANVDGQSGSDISDLSALIDYLYISFSPPATCN